MSLLSDLLSKIKQPQFKKDIPPNLRSVVSSSKKTETKRKRLVLLMTLLLMIVGSGFAAVYIFDKFSQEEHQKRIHIAKRFERDKNEDKEAVKQEVRDAKSEDGAKTTEDKDIKVETVLKIEPDQKSSKKSDELSRKTHPQTEKKDEDAKPSEEAATAKKESPAAESKTTFKVEMTRTDTYEKDLYLYQARDFELKGRFQEAIESYRKVLNIEEKNYRVMNNIASIFIRLKLCEDAVSYLREAIKLKKDYTPALINIAVALACTGQLQDSERHLLKALEFEPHNREALFNLGVLYERQGRTENAREYFMKLKHAGDKRGEAAIERLKN